MKYICAHPMTDYYLWQTRVMVGNFKDNGISSEDIYILCAHEGLLNHEWVRFAKASGVNIFFFPDRREDKSYQPSMYFNLMKSFFMENPDMINYRWFMHDVDIAFTKHLNLSFAEQSDDIFLSDTNSYINYDYVVSKGERQFIDMCAVVGINPEVVKANNNHSGGAQYIVSGLDAAFFDKVESDSLKLFMTMARHERDYVKKHEADYPIQRWTAGMWSFLWNLWLFKRNTIVDSRLNFCMGSDRIERIADVAIYHNAGVVASMRGTHFSKTDYINTNPKDTNLTLGDNASRWYYEQIKKYL